MLETAAVKHAAHAGRNIESGQMTDAVLAGRPRETDAPELAAKAGA